MENLRIIVLGDANVGKSTFLELITENFEAIYPINSFDYFTYFDETKEQTQNNKKYNNESADVLEESRIEYKRSSTTNTTTNNNINNETTDELMENIFLQAKQNFLRFIENKMETQFGNSLEKQKHTYGCRVFPFLWIKNEDSGYENHTNIHAASTGVSVKQNETIKEQSDIHYLNNNNLDTKWNTIIIIEFCEIGGSQTYSCIRNIFYKDYDGIMLVYDSTNRKSYHNLVNWLYELYIRRKCPSDTFCPIEKKKQKNGSWKIFFKKQKPNVPQSNTDNNATKRESAYSNYDDEKCKNNYEDDFVFDEGLDIEKGTFKKNDDILKGEIPIVLLSTKIDKINSKTKPKDVIPKNPGFFSKFFFQNLSLDSIYDKEKGSQEKKKNLIQLQQHISQAKEIKCSAVDCVVDMDNFFKFLNSVYNKKFH